MSITAKVRQGVVALPPEVHLPDGTEVEIVVLERQHANGSRTPVRLPVFGGSGVQPGVDLDDSRVLRQLLEEEGQNPQLT